MKFLRSTFLTALLALIGGAVYAGCRARATFTQHGNTVIFYNDSSTSLTGNHTLTWKLGDGTTGSGDQVVHQYASGTYNAKSLLWIKSSCTEKPLEIHIGHRCDEVATENELHVVFDKKNIHHQKEITKP
jgi:hypothetical protein